MLEGFFKNSFYVFQSIQSLCLLLVCSGFQCTPDLVLAVVCSHEMHLFLINCLICELIIFMAIPYHSFNSCVISCNAYSFFFLILLISVSSLFLFHLAKSWSMLSF
jgi:hypothetical protein